MATLRVQSHPFEPVIDAQAEILILGSFPSVVSEKEGYYYAHPRNRFYPMLSRLFNEDFVRADWLTKRALLLKHHIALHDVIAYCRIVNSADNDIRDVKPADIPGLLQQAPIRLILLNGATAARLYHRYFASLAIPAIPMPSTSPANAKMTLDDLVEAWSRALLP